MKKISLIASFIAVSVLSFAQTYNLSVTKNNGQTVVIPTDEITKIEFVDAGDQPSSYLLLDVVFDEDGTAHDASLYKHDVITHEGASLMTYYSDIHHRYVANFRHSAGASVTSGYYRVNYKAGDDFISRIADGCTLESIVMLGDTDPSNLEVKWFSSMQAGGIGFIMPTHNRSTCLTFLPNVSTNGSSNWRWTHSQVTPEVGKYYHVVGVWNKEEGKSYIYINGKLSGTATAPGNYVPVAAGAESFLIGGDAEPNQTVCASAWNGDIVTARIYDQPMDETQVAALWEASKFEESAKVFSITNLQFMANCEVGAGYKYTVYGDGFEQGDAIELQSGSTFLNPESSVGEGSVTVVIPSQMTSGSYKFVVKRGDVKIPLCTVNFTVSATPAAPKTPKVIAHRGAHTDGAAENSVAALRKAMDANYYGIELDVWRTTDGRVVVHHDGKANGLTFSACTYDQIKNIKLSNGELLPTLDSFIATFKEKMNSSSSKLIIEIKPWNDHTLVDLVMKMVEDAGIKDRVEYIAFSLDNCKYIVSKQPDALVGYLNGDLAPAEVKALGIVSVDYSTGAYAAHPSWIKEARDLGVIVNVWTVNSSAAMLEYMSQGVDYITTDAPALLDELAKKRFVEP